MTTIMMITAKMIKTETMLMKTMTTMIITITTMMTMNKTRTLMTMRIITITTTIIMNVLITLKKTMMSDRQTVYSLKYKQVCKKI